MGYIKTKEGFIKLVKVMKANEIITRIRQACDAIYEKYEGNPLIEKDDIIAPFEDIINDYYEDLSPM